MYRIVRLPTLVAILALLAGRAIAQVDLCKTMISGGVFDTRHEQTKFSSYNNYRSVYCSSAGSDYGSAKSLDASATIPIDSVLTTFGLNANESDYNKWHSELCSSQESLYTSDYWNTTQAKTASGKLLEEFNKCVANFTQGLVQYVSIPSNDSKLFSWTLVNHPDSGSSITTKVTVEPSHNIKCAGLPPTGEKTFSVGPEGQTLNCQRTDCDGALLVLNATRTPYPTSLTLPAISLPPDPPTPPPHFASITVPMTRPIADKLPGVDPDEKCEISSGVGNWNAGPSGALPFSCGNYPQPVVKGGVATSDYDSYYLDNSGSCTFTFKCWREVTVAHRVLPDWCAVK